jgi:hypothetical protein
LIIDGIEAAKTLTPASSSELAEILSSEKGAIVPVGAGTQLEFGNPLQGADLAICTAGLRYTLKPV